MVRACAFSIVRKYGKIAEKTPDSEFEFIIRWKYEPLLWKCSNQVWNSHRSLTSNKVNDKKQLIFLVLTAYRSLKRRIKIFLVETWEVSG